MKGQAFMHNKKAQYIILFATTLIVCAFMFMPENVILGRYISSFDGGVTFAATAADQSYVYDSDGNSVSEVIWTEDSALTSFIVTNYHENNVPARQDLSVKIRIVVPDLPEYKNLEFTVNDTATSYEAQTYFLSINSPLYSECREWFKNNGVDEDVGYWVYYFCDTDGEEVRWLLPGGNISERKYNLQLYTANANLDTSCLMIDIIDVQNQKGAIQ